MRLTVLVKLGSKPELLLAHFELLFRHLSWCLQPAIPCVISFRATLCVAL